MRLSLTSIVFALVGFSLGVPFKPSSIPVSVPCSGTLSAVPTSSPSSSDVPLPNPFAPSSTRLAKSTGAPPRSTPVYAGGPVEWPHTKRGGIPIPTGLSSLASEAESALGSFTSFAPIKRGGLPIPTGFSSLVSEAESAFGSFPSFAPRKRALMPRSSATPTTSCFPTSIPFPTPSGIPSSLPSPPSVPLSFPTGFSLSGLMA